MRSEYFTSTRVEETVESGDLRMTFHGWTHSLEDYAVALHDAGFAIELIREPIPAADTQYRRWARVPLFMNVRAVRRQAAASA